MYSLLWAQGLQSYFSLLLPQGEGEARAARAAGRLEREGNQLLSQFWGRRGSPGKKEKGEGEGEFWKKRRLFLSQERREHCLRQWPSWGCVTLRSPTSNGLCVRLSHGADLRFRSLLLALWPALFHPLIPSPPPADIPSFSSAPSALGLRPSSTHFSLEPQSHPLCLFRLPAPTSSSLEGCMCFQPDDPAPIDSRLEPQSDSPTRRAGFGMAQRKGRNGAAQGRGS